MRIGFAVLILAGALAACGKKDEADAPPAAEIVQTPEAEAPLTTETAPVANRLGPFRIGSTREELDGSGLEFTPGAIQIEGDSFPVMTTSFLGADIAAYLTSDAADATVWRLETKSPEYETKEGAKVGDTIARLKELYPAGHVLASEEEGLSLSFITETAGQIFRFDAKRITRDCVRDAAKCPADMDSLPSVALWVT